ncbi:MAG: hypothetical protein K9I95_14575 [Flavobacteriaceae bacterium]|nr:hypothetical protein [Flavobacteriaceae bacterium]
MSNTKIPLFQIKCLDKAISIIPVSSSAIYMNEIPVINEVPIKSRTIISTNEHPESIFFTININSELAINDEQDILVHFLDSNELPSGSGFDILDFLKNGADKLQIDEFFSIIAQVDVPEIDQ